MKSTIVPCNINNIIRIAIARAEDRFGSIDVLVNNVGFGYFSSIEKGEDEKIRNQFETNVFGLIQMTQAMLPRMRNK